MERKSNCACANSTIGLLTIGASFLDFILNFFGRIYFIAIIVIISGSGGGSGVGRPGVGRVDWRESAVVSADLEVAGLSALAASGALSGAAAIIRAADNFPRRCQASHCQ